uniref:Uncharacterized protein n=1 Tax=Physcomitrium patens TaxID=3218 RepID=A0A2K1KH21_PHYPA|nr:hypothetical protein PHYPA_009440 [Physcomitrium patens]
MNQTTSIDYRDSTPWNDVPVTPGRRDGVDKGSTPRTGFPGPPSVRRAPQPEYYQPSDA